MWLTEGTEVCRVLWTSRAMCVCVIVPIAFLRFTGGSRGSFSRVLSFCFFLCYTSIFSNGDLNFLWLSLFVFILLLFSVCIEHFN